MIFSAPTPVTFKKNFITPKEMDAFHAVTARHHLPKADDLAPYGLSVDDYEAIAAAYRRTYHNHTSPWSLVQCREKTTAETLAKEMALNDKESTFWAHSECYLEINTQKPAANGGITYTKYFVSTIDGIHASFYRITRTAKPNGRISKMTKEVPITPFKRQLFAGSLTLLADSVDYATLRTVFEKELRKNLRSAQKSELNFAFLRSESNVREAIDVQTAVEAFNAIPWWMADDADVTLVPYQVPVAKAPKRKAAQKPNPSQPVSEYLVDKVNGSTVTLVEWPSMEATITAQTIAANMSANAPNLAPAAIVKGFVKSGIFTCTA